MTEENFIKNLPAFPHEHRTGMTLRDYFAAKAMQALIPVWATNEDERADLQLDDLADWAYAQADAMLRAR